ncbi:MAG: ATP-binding protein [Paludibacter sp.]
MKSPEIPLNEKERLIALESYSVLDTLPEEDYDNLTTIAAEICGSPIALISLIDKNRQWFKSHYGLAATETPREIAFCAHAINDADKILIVTDSRLDNRFHDNPLVTGDPHVVFYAGVPLVNNENLALGTLCVIDHNPKTLSESQLKSLESLGKQVVNLLELRRNKKLLEETVHKLQEKNHDLERFASVAAHDLKSPLIGISGISKLFSEKYDSVIDENGKYLLSMMVSATNKLRILIDGLLEYSRTESVINENKTLIKTSELTDYLIELYSHGTNLEIKTYAGVNEFYANNTAIDQILINLVANAIKYNDKELIQINISFTDYETHYECIVEDNGVGIPESQFEKIFLIFESSGKKDRFGNTGNGIGLATVKKMVEIMGGKIHVESEIGKGSKFIFTFKK